MRGTPGTIIDTAITDHHPISLFSAQGRFPVHWVEEINLIGAVSGSQTHNMLHERQPIQSTRPGSPLQSVADGT